MSSRAFGALGALLVAASCATRAPPPAEAASNEEIELHQGPLTDYVPAPTLEWLLWAEPARIARQPGVLRELTAWIDEAAWHSFEERNGFDLRTTPHLLGAGFPFGTLVLLPSSDRDDTIERRFRERLLHHDATTSRPHPALSRLHGVTATAPEALLRAHDRLVALATGDLTLVRFVEGYLLRRLVKTPPALEGVTLRPHARFAEGAPLRLWVTAPFDEALPLPVELREEASAVILAAEFFELAVDRKVEPEAESPQLGLRLRLAVAGPWDPNEISPEPLKRAWSALAESSLGHLLDLEAPLREPEFGVTRPDGANSGARLELTVELPLGPLLQRLQGLLVGSLSDLFAFDSSRSPLRSPQSEFIVSGLWIASFGCADFPAE